MMDLCCEARFAKEAIAVAFVGEQSLLHHLDAAERVEVDVARFEDLAHSARAEQIENLVLAVEDGARPELRR